MPRSVWKRRPEDIEFMREIGRRGGVASRKSQTTEHIHRRVESRAGYSHSTETRAQIGASNRGKTHSTEQNQQHAEFMRERYKQNPEPSLDGLMKARLTKGPTRLERALGKLLAGAGLEFERERRFGVYCVDAYVPSHNLIFEADGSWRHIPRKDAARDRYLIRGGVAAVIRLVEQDLQSFMER